jgi:hypothetical protein
VFDALAACNRFVSVSWLQVQKSLDLHLGSCYDPRIRVMQEECYVTLPEQEKCRVTVPEEEDEGDVTSVCPGEADELVYTKIWTHYRVKRPSFPCYKTAGCNCDWKNILLQSPLCRSHCMTGIYLLVCPQCPSCFHVCHSNHVQQ